ncbi:hypothetical protein [Ulvibacter litoralis]|uniref:Uncharacterized protein n=1 Tax=Ulvibacter litoralis TaxID=227084 RepID=A0A1G7JYW6_9FLAO|nr:hypothetical protein [Ulvibacter litoralis]GHC66176.1 hypothetical protein GCM10008083_34010 [Ulvibacter litoralis]SDF30100.1 hypothetical protein SAMN05421855_1381 [Ulvibacter litoralis]
MNKNCQVLGCKKEIKDSSRYCEFHSKGGVFGNGETYELYQIIEQDFIDFIKIIPINDPDHFKVHSPILQDIIVRSCVQIEFFFKEWAKYSYSKFVDSDLLEKYQKIKKSTGLETGARAWNFIDYFPFLKYEMISKKIYVRPLEKHIEPFKDWTNPKKTPNWWNVYNGIKHDGINTKKEANLKMALESLAALFLVHCNNKFSHAYLRQFTINQVMAKGTDFVLKKEQISTPLDSKKYLFKEYLGFKNSSVKIATNQELIDRVTFKGKSV